VPVDHNLVALILPLAQHLRGESERRDFYRMWTESSLMRKTEGGTMRFSMVGEGFSAGATKR
jgi:hypothetical protein